MLAFDTCLGAVSVAVRWRGAGGEWLMRDALRGARARTRRAAHADDRRDDAGGWACLLRHRSHSGRPSAPARFTGVRVGVAAARGLALASGVTTVGATSLAVMAHQADERLGASRGGRLLVVAVDARRDAVYLQLFPGAHGDAAEPPLRAFPRRGGPPHRPAAGDRSSARARSRSRPQSARRADERRRRSSICSRMRARWPRWRPISSPPTHCGRSISGRPMSNRRPTAPCREPLHEWWNRLSPRQHSLGLARACRRSCPAARGPVREAVGRRQLLAPSHASGLHLVPGPGGDAARRSSASS